MELIVLGMFVVALWPIVGAIWNAGWGGKLAVVVAGVLVAGAVAVIGMVSWALEGGVFDEIMVQVMEAEANAYLEELAALDPEVARVSCETFIYLVDSTDALLAHYPDNLVAGVGRLWACVSYVTGEPVAEIADQTRPFIRAMREHQ